MGLMKGSEEAGSQKSEVGRKLGTGGCPDASGVEATTWEVRKLEVGSIF